MKQQLVQHCPKCGAVMSGAEAVQSGDGTAVLEQVCSACRRQEIPALSKEAQPFTRVELGEELFSLVDSALMDDLPPDAIGLALCDALTSLAEHAYPGHSFSIAFLDLGETDSMLNLEPFPDLVETLRERYVQRKRT